MTSLKHIAIIGATSKIAEHCCRIWAHNQPYQFSLVARNKEKLQGIADDLQVRNPRSKITLFGSDFLTPANIKSTVNHIYKTGQVNIVLIAHGLLPEQFQCENNLEDIAFVTQINGLSPVLFAEAFIQHMKKNNQGTIAFISSVAGDRGRKSNYIYGAAKGYLSHYAQGLQHRFAKCDLHIVVIKPGPTDTPMTAKLKARGERLAPAKQVANDIVTAIRKKRTHLYSPKRWWFIMMVIKILPRFIFNRLEI